MTEYIDREAVLAAIQNLYPGIPLVKANLKKWHEQNRDFMACEAAIERIPAADVRPVVTCADCKHNNACLTQAFVEDESRVPFDRSTFFCADGKRADDA